MNEREQIAYLAGLFDAEGSIIIEKKKSGQLGHRVRYALVVAIVNTRPELVQIAHDRYGGNIVDRIENYHHKPLEEDELQAREEIYQRFRQLNKRGVKVEQSIEVEEED